MSRNPWIDPRVRDVQPESARAYLLARGWAQAPDSRPYLWRFDAPTTDGPIALVPTFEPTNEYCDFVARLIVIVALQENRQVEDVLDDLLATTPVATNGAAEPRHPARKKTAG